MKKIIFAGLFSFLVLSGGVLAEQPGEQKKGSPMQGMMEQMMGNGGMHGSMEGMMGMRGQTTKMMDQCAAMMESMHSESRQTQEEQKK